MAGDNVNLECRRILVIMPGQLDEAVMATATLHAIRGLYPEAHITALIKRRLRPVLHGLDSVDRVLSIRKRKGLNKGSRKGPRKGASKGGSKARGRVSLVRLGRRLARGRFDTAVILPGSFKAAVLAAVAGIPRRIGYERDGRGALLTDRLVTRRYRHHAKAESTLDAYLGIARYMGARHPSATMHQHVQPDAEARLDRRLAEAGVAPTAELFLISLRAAHASRRWSPRRMAHLCEMLVERFGLTPAIIDAPADRETAQALNGRANLRVVDLSPFSSDVHMLKAAAARSRMMISHDAELRYLATALGVPVMTLFGPTRPTYDASDLAYEEHVIADGLSLAARDNPRFRGEGCMDRLHVDRVFEHACALYLRTQMVRIGAGV